MIPSQAAMQLDPDPFVGVCAIRPFQNAGELPEVLRPDSGNKTARDAALDILLKELDLYDLANLEADPLEFVRQLQAEMTNRKRQRSTTARPLLAEEEKEAMADALADLLKGAKVKAPQEGEKPKPVLPLSMLRSIVSKDGEDADDVEVRDSKTLGEIFPKSDLDDERDSEEEEEEEDEEKDREEKQLEKGAASISSESVSRGVFIISISFEIVCVAVVFASPVLC